MNDWFWLQNRVQVSNMQWVSYNVSFGMRLSVFQFQLDHLLAVWTCANYLSPLNLSILICKIRIMVHIPRFVSKIKWHDTYQALKRIPHTWKVSVSNCYCMEVVGDQLEIEGWDHTEDWCECHREEYGQCIVGKREITLKVFDSRNFIMRVILQKE